MGLEPPTIFELWVERWRNAMAAARSHDVDETTSVWKSARQPLPNKVRQVETTLNLKLPAQLRQTLLEFSGRVDFSWYLRSGDDPPPSLAGVFCGGCHWNVSRMVKDYQRIVWLAENAFVEDVPGEAIWKGKLPFHSIMCGDFIAVDQRSGGVVYLGHELAGSHAHWLGRDFYDFMHRWTVLGCPDDDIWDRFVVEKNGFIDLDHKNSKLWCQWFGLPPTSNV